MGRGENGIGDLFSIFLEILGEIWEISPVERERERDRQRQNR